MAIKVAGHLARKKKHGYASGYDGLDGSLAALDAQQELLRSYLRKYYVSCRNGVVAYKKKPGFPPDGEKRDRMMAKYNKYMMGAGDYDPETGLAVAAGTTEALAVPNEEALLAKVLELSKPLPTPPMKPVVLPAFGGSSLAAAAAFIAMVSLGAAVPVAFAVAATGAAVTFGGVLLASVPYRARLQRATALRSARQRLALVAARVSDRPSRERLEAAAGRVESLTDAASRLQDPAAREAVLAVVAASTRLITYLASYPERTPGSRKFLEYYPETAEELAAALLEMETNGITCKDEDRAREQTVAALHELAQAFDAHIVAVNDYRVLGISATTEALRSSLRSEGFLRGSPEGTSVGEAAPAAMPEEPRDASVVPVQEPLAGGLAATQRAAIRGRGSESLI